jgi:predicted Zn-dependent peptidase
LYTKTTLDNGLRVITAEMPNTVSVSVCIFIGTGSRYEDDKIAGASHFIEHVVFRGTDKRPTAREISEAIEGVGGVLNGGTDKETTLFWCKVASQHFALGLDVLVDMLLHPRFETADIESERPVIIEEIKMGNDSPSQRVSQVIDELLCPGQPLGRDIAGSKETVQAMSRDDMLGYLKSHYLPGNAVVAIAGGVSHSDVLKAVKKTMGGWSSSSKPPTFKPFIEKKAGSVKIEHRDIEQAHLCIALHGYSAFHPDRFKLDLLNVILGEGMSCRLFYEVRDKLGLAYSISSFVEHYSDAGCLTVYAGIKPEKLALTVKTVLGQLTLLKKELVSPAELTKAKEAAKGRMLLRMEDSHNVAGWFGGQEILTGKILTMDEVVAIIDSVTAEDIMGVAKDLFVSKALRLAVVGPVKADETVEKLLKV